MMYVMTLLIFLPIVVMMSVTPYITRKTESFGITIPSSMFNDPVFVGFRKSYAQWSALLGIGITALLLVLIGFLSEQVWAILFSVIVFVYIIGTFFVYFHFHKKMKQLKEERKWFIEKKETIAVDLKFYSQKKTHSNWWFLIPFSITVLTAILTFINYDLFPEKLPMQYNFQGEVTRWADKTTGTLMMFPILQLFMTGLFLLVNNIIAKSKQQVNPEAPEESVAQNLIFRRRWSLFTIISGTLLVLLFSLTNLSFFIQIEPDLLFIIIMTITMFIVLGAFMVTILTGQGGSRVRIGLDKNNEVIHRDEDQHWKLGVFYFNPDDPALFVEKRFGSGWTVNMARPLTWVITIAIIVIPLLIVFLLEM